MIKYYKLIILLFFCANIYSQQALKDFDVSKAWVNEKDGWSEVTYKSEFVVSTNTDGELKITNFDFLNEFCQGKANLINLEGYNSAEFSSPRKIKTNIDQNGFTNIAFEGMLLFKAKDGYYTVSTKVILLVSKSNIIGFKIKTVKDSKEYMFSLKAKV